jgi:hypothetical protein
LISLNKFSKLSYPVKDTLSTPAWLMKKSQFNA